MQPHGTAAGLANDRSDTFAMPACADTNPWIGEFNFTSIAEAKEKTPRASAALRKATISSSDICSASSETFMNRGVDLLVENAGLIALDPLLQRQEEQP